MLKNLFSLLIIFSLSLMLTSSAFAQGIGNLEDTVGDGIESYQNSQNSEGITNPVIGDLGDDPAQATAGVTFTRYFIILWQALISVGALLVLIYFLWGGIEWISAGGESSKVQKARDRMTQAVIGLIVLVGSFVIIGWISTIFFGTSFSILELQFLEAGVN